MSRHDLKSQRLLLSKPNNFRVEYAINPWMQPGTGDPKLALEQWQNLVATLEDMGVETEIMDCPADAPPEIIWPRDDYILLIDRIILAKFKHPVRQLEIPYYQQWFENHGYKTEPSQATFEGGNAILQGGKLYVGTGYRATAEDCDILSRQFGIEVVPLPVTDNRFFHIDIALFSLDDDQAFYYPPAFSGEAQNILNQNIAQLHELSEAEMEGFCANSISIGDNVVIQSGNPSFLSKLEQLGKKVREVDVSEFKQSSGGIHCLTNTLSTVG